MFFFRNFRNFVTSYDGASSPRKIPGVSMLFHINGGYQGVGLACARTRPGATRGQGGRGARGRDAGARGGDCRPPTTPGEGMPASPPDHGH